MEQPSRPNGCPGLLRRTAGSPTHKTKAKRRAKATCDRGLARKSGTEGRHPFRAPQQTADP